MIDLQGALYSAQMVSEACASTGDALRLDASKYVERGEFRLAVIACALADFCEATVIAKRMLEEEVAAAPK